MENTPRYVFLGLVVLVVGGLVAIGVQTRNRVPPPKPTLQGAGSSFVAPLMVLWAAAYEKTEDGGKIDYRSLGSGGGIKLLTQQKVDFGCTDGPMTDAQLEKARSAGGEVLHVPLVLGAVVPAYHLPGVKGPLRFTGPVLADIYLGKVKKWNAEALADLNRGVKLPDKEIVVVHRRDDSGTTYIWADYLAKVSPQWKQEVGVGVDIKWPTGEAEVGNEGVAEYVQSTPYSIGYVELSYAVQMDLPFGLVRNRGGEFVKASLPGVRATAANALVDIPEDLRYSLTDAPGKESYPICGTTWAIVYAEQPPEKGKQLADFLRWAIGAGQERVERVFYARLPDSLLERASKNIDQIRETK
jgi:phosphate transport system substrate-binding protein